MAGRILNRRELRKEADHGEQSAAAAAGAAGITKPKKKAKAPAKPRKPRAKKSPTRYCARWGVFDNGMRQVAIFDFNQRAAADAKLADLLAKKKGTHFLQIVKEPMPEPAVAEATGAPT